MSLLALAALVEGNGIKFAASANWRRPLLPSWLKNNLCPAVISFLQFGHHLARSLRARCQPESAPSETWPRETKLSRRHLEHPRYLEGGCICGRRGIYGGDGDGGKCSLDYDEMSPIAAVGATRAFPARHGHTIDWLANYHAQSYRACQWLDARVERAPISRLRFIPLASVGWLVGWFARSP